MKNNEIISKGMNCRCCSKHVPLPTICYTMTISDRIESVCPTTFFNIEQLLTEYKITDSIPSGRIRKHYSQYVQRICMELWNDNLRNDER